MTFIFFLALMLLALMLAGARIMRLMGRIYKALDPASRDIIERDLDHIGYCAVAVTILAGGIFAILIYLSGK